MQLIFEIASSYAVTNLAVHIVMVLRMYGLYGQSAIVLFSLGGLAILDFVVEMVASTYVQRQSLHLSISSITQLVVGVEFLLTPR